MTAITAMTNTSPHAPAGTSGMRRLCRNWLGIEGRPADAAAARLAAALSAFRGGDVKRIDDLLSMAAEDPRLLGDVTAAVLDWMREAGTLQSNPRLALEMMNMRRLFREAMAEREAPPAPERLLEASAADEVTVGVSRLAAAALLDMAEQLRGAWLMERRCASLPRWRHWDVMLEVRPGVLLGETDVPERVASLIDAARSRLERLWLADGTIAVHAYPVHAGRALLNHMRERGLVILGAGMAEARTAKTGLPHLRSALVDETDDVLHTAPSEVGTDEPALRGSLDGDVLDPEADISGPDAARGQRSSSDDEKGSESDRGLLDEWLAPLRERLPMPVSDMLREGRRHAMLMGLSLLPAFIAWQMLMPDATQTRLAAFEKTHAELMAARPWRREEGADALDPLKTLEAYRGALRDLDATPSLPIYTEETRQFLLGRFRSRLGMEQEWQALFECSDPRISFRGDLAVVQFREDKVACAPFFFRKEGGRWRLDMKARASLIAEGPKGAWQWRAGVPPEGWRFAFAPQPAGEYEPGP